MSAIASTFSGAPPAASGWVPSPLYRMTVEEYEKMVASGAFHGRRRLHMIHGPLVEKTTQNPPHTIADDLCGQELARALPGWYIRAAKPIRLPNQASEPEPDRCVVRGSARRTWVSIPARLISP
jgi:Uma2 family endonuclease